MALEASNSATREPAAATHRSMRNQRQNNWGVCVCAHAHAWKCSGCRLPSFSVCVCVWIDSANYLWPKNVYMRKDLESDSLFFKSVIVYQYFLRNVVVFFSDILDHKIHPELRKSDPKLLEPHLVRTKLARKTCFGVTKFLPIDDPKLDS